MKLYRRFEDLTVSPLENSCSRKIYGTRYNGTLRSGLGESLHTTINTFISGDALHV